jgi:hypothetical protein
VTKNTPDNVSAFAFHIVMSFKDVGLRLEPQTLLVDVTCVTANDRQDPLFTMSDNTPTSHARRDEFGFHGRLSVHFSQ